MSGRLPVVIGCCFSTLCRCTINDLVIVNLVGA